MTTPYETGFAVPTLDTLISRKDADLDAQLSGIDAFVPGSDEWALARVQAGGDYLTHGMIGAALREWFPDCASAANIERIGARYGLTRNQATATQVTITVTATAVPAAVPIGTLLVGNDDVDYETTGALAIPGPGLTGTVDVRSTTQGTATQLTVGATLNFATPPVDIVATATVSAITGGSCQAGEDVEDIEDYRVRILDRIASVPQGGAATDYETWAMDMDGVTKVWVHVPPTVTRGHVRVVYTGSTAVGIIDAALELLAPVTAIVDTVKATPYGVAVSIQAKALPAWDTGPLHTQLESDVEDAINALCEQQGGPLLNLYNSQIRAAIANVEGIDYFTIADCIFGGAATGSPNSNATAPYNQAHAVAPGDMVWAAWL